MLESIFSTRGRYGRYALCVATITFGYLYAGFVSAKYFFLGELTGFSITTIAGLIVGGIAFAAVHIRSMRQLDKVKAKNTDS